MTEYNAALALVGGSVLLLGLFSARMKRWGLPEPLILVLLGVALGPLGAGLLNPQHWGDQKVILEQAARLALAIGLMGAALRLPPDYLTHGWRSLVAVLGLAMPAMWLSGSLLVGLILGLPAWPALLIGAALTPTDPVVASTIVTGQVAEESLPARLRHLLSGESGPTTGWPCPSSCCRCCS